MTQFELLTAAALDELARREVEVAVVEAGLGGRWDATNVLGAGVCVLTNVGLEHTRWLGPTVADIAREKLAVVRPEATLVLGDVDDEVLALAQGPARGSCGRSRSTSRCAATSARTSRSPRPPPTAQHGALEPAQVAEVAARVRVPGPPAGRRRGPADDPRRRPQPVRDGRAGRRAARRRRRPAARRRGQRARRQGRRGHAPRADREVCARWSSPPPATRARSRPPRWPRWPSRSAGRPPRSCATRMRPCAARTELAGPDGAVLATGSIYLVADLVGEAAGRRASAL